MCRSRILHLWEGDPSNTFFLTKNHQHISQRAILSFLENQLLRKWVGLVLLTPLVNCDLSERSAPHPFGSAQGAEEGLLGQFMKQIGTHSLKWTQASYLGNQ